MRRGARFFSAASGSCTWASRGSGRSHVRKRANPSCQGQKNATPMPLNRLWNSASCSSALPPKPNTPASACTSHDSGASSNKASNAVVPLNSTCASARRCPLRLPPSMPTTAVLMLLPTLAPIASASAWSSCRCPEPRPASVRISVAWLDCSTTVAAMPMPANSSVGLIPPTATPSRSSAPPIAEKPPLSWSMPRKMKAMPSTTRPAALLRSPRKPASTPNTSNGSARGERLKFCPASASSQMPDVAPRLAPKMIAMPPANWINPVLTKAIVSSDTSVLDCSSAVPPMPNSRPRTGVPVLRASHCSSLLPASLRSPSSSICMPNRNIASPAHSSSQPALRQKLQASSSATASAGNRRRCPSNLRQRAGVCSSPPGSISMPVMRHPARPDPARSRCRRPRRFPPCCGQCRTRWPAPA